MLSKEDRATIMDACQVISRNADDLKAAHTVGDDWGCDVEVKAVYESELRLLERLVAMLGDSKHGSVTLTLPSTDAARDVLALKHLILDLRRTAARLRECGSVLYSGMIIAQMVDHHADNFLAAIAAQTGSKDRT